MSFMGLDSFVWFQGVVEDRDDPMRLGRCKVRCLGFHSESKVDIPTDSLPWAYPIQPLTSAAMSGIGTTPLGPVEGTWVVGFFRDGRTSQEPVIFGTIGGIPEEASNPANGFSDPNVNYPRVKQLAEPDTNRLARPDSTMLIPIVDGIYNTVVQKKLAELDKGVVISEGGTWDEPPTPYDATYPYNHVRESESGHIEEWDDTDGAERMHRYHRSGTFEEVHPDGTKVTKIVGDEFKIVEGDSNTHIKGNCNLTVDGNLNIQVTGKITIHNDGTYELISGGNHLTIAPRIDLNP